MNCFERYLVELLQGNISYDNKVVEVRKTFLPSANLPCITLDLSQGVTTDYMFYDVSTATEKAYQHCTSHININVWCNTEEERESINNQVLECYRDEFNHHYKYCTNYDDGYCSTTSSVCPAVARGRRGKFQCTDDVEYGYSSLRRKHGLIEDKLRIESPFDLDEYDKHPPILRSVLRASCEYEEKIRDFGRPYKEGI